jgi:hypothetical protein
MGEVEAGRPSVWVRLGDRGDCGRARQLRRRGGGWGRAQRARVWEGAAARLRWAARALLGRGMRLGQGRPVEWRWATGGEAGAGWAGRGKGEERVFSFLYFPYFFCYCVFRFWFINFEIQMNFENFE